MCSSTVYPLRLLTISQCRLRRRRSAIMFTHTCRADSFDVDSTIIFTYIIFTHTCRALFTSLQHLSPQQHSTPILTPPKKKKENNIFRRLKNIYSSALVGTSSSLIQHNQRTQTSQILASTINTQLEYSHHMSQLHAHIDPHSRLH